MIHQQPRQLGSLHCALALAWALHALPIPAGAVTPGSYKGTTAQGKSITIEVGANGHVTGWSVNYSCPGFTGGQVVTISSCPITGNSFTCGSLGCSPFVGRSRISGTFSGNSVSGTFTINHQPNQFSSCCVLSNISYTATLQGSGPTIPAAPSNLVAAPLSQTEIDLDWTDNSTNEDEFRVELKEGGSGFQDIGGVPANPDSTAGAKVSGLDPATTYIFRVRARNGAGSSGYSNEASATTFGSTGPCTPNDTTLCIDDVPGDRRFEARITFQTNAATPALPGHAVSLASLGITRGGLFWFFNPANPELLLKVLGNGCAANGKIWIFYSAGTNVGFTVRVRDSQTGATWQRTNPIGTAAPPVQDTSALNCP